MKEEISRNNLDNTLTMAMVHKNKFRGMLNQRKSIPSKQNQGNILYQVKNFDIILSRK